MTSTAMHSHQESRPIVVLVEPSQFSVDVVKAAAGVAVDMDARVILLEVTHSKDGLVRRARMRAGRSMLDEDAFSHLPKLTAILEGVGVDVSVSVHEGELVESILSEARLARARMIVIGSKGRAGEPPSLSSSIAHAVTCEIDLPVMVVRIPTELERLMGDNEARRPVGAMGAGRGSAVRGWGIASSE